MSGLESWDAKVAKQARSLLTEYHDLFSLEKNEIGRTKVVEHSLSSRTLMPLCLRNSLGGSCLHRLMR